MSNMEILVCILLSFLALYMLKMLIKAILYVPLFHNKPPYIEYIKNKVCTEDKHKFK